MSTKDFLEKDYYKALGVSKTAKPAEIKAAYRKLARKYHPDANKGDASAEERFKEISAAYDVLGDETKRKEYDEVRTLGPMGGYQGAGGGPGGFSFTTDNPNRTYRYGSNRRYAPPPTGKFMPQARHVAIGISRTLVPSA